MQALSLTTDHLRVGRIGLDDADFIFRLVNDPDWTRFVGDKSVGNLDDARACLRPCRAAPDTTGLDFYPADLTESRK